MSELHYGRLPTDRHLLEHIRRSHKLGFRTILLSEFQELEAQGISLDLFDLVVPTTRLPVNQDGEDHGQS
jgi:hypothetical protein